MTSSVLGNDVVVIVVVDVDVVVVVIVDVVVVVVVIVVVVVVVVGVGVGVVATLFLSSTRSLLPVETVEDPQALRASFPHSTNLRPIQVKYSVRYN